VCPCGWLAARRPTAWRRSTLTKPAGAGKSATCLVSRALWDVTSPLADGITSLLRYVHKDLGTATTLIRRARKLRSIAALCALLKSLGKEERAETDRA